MTKSEVLIRAALNRLSIRLGDKMVEKAAEITSLAQEAPDRLRKELESFKNEVLEEVERINQEEKDNQNENIENIAKETITKKKIDSIRTKILEISKEIGS